MVREKSAGVIVFRIHPKEGVQYLVLYHRGTYWNFSKGHVEPNEAENQTALRELGEETGLKNVKLVKDWRQTTHFFFKEDRNGKKELIRKQFILFLAKVPHTVEVRPCSKFSSHEVINGYAWLDYDTASKYLKFKSMREILTEADSYIQAKIKNYQNQKQTVKTGKKKRK